MSETRDWRCHRCDKLLGRVAGERLHIRTGRFEYRVAMPATTTCHGCGALNELFPRFVPVPGMVRRDR